MLLALLLQATVSSASPAMPAPPATFVVEPVAMTIAGFDLDGDGRISRAELDRGVARSFATTNAGADATIGYLAFADWAERWLGDRNALPSPFEIDRDGDNRITLAEMQVAFGRVFARLDIDKNALLTHKELLTIRAMPGRETGERQGKK